MMREKNKEAMMKAIDADLEKMRNDHAEFFGQKRVVILLASLARYSKERGEGSNVINLINKLDLLIKDLRNCGYTDMFGEKDAFMYILNFIRDKWEQDIVKVENWEQFWEQYLRSDDEY